MTGAQLATAFEGPLERQRVSFGYRVGLAAVAGLMVLLPVVYFGMIAGACWLVWYHATHSVAMFHGVRGRVVILPGIAYVAPIVAGGLLVLAMVVPLFWRPRRGPKPFWVDRREQPLLYAYVDKLCDVMRAPRPARIDIVAAANASAHVDNGVFGLVRRRLVLTLGLPLARTMTLKQFTGVVAHELGHFSQGSSMRLSYVVHHVNGWRAARIVGGEAMGEGLQASPFIDAAFGLAVERAQAGWQQRRRLPDDLVAFAHDVYGHLPAPLKDTITGEIPTSEASWFDTHPPLYARVAALMKSKPRGVLTLDAPATVLFKDFDELSKIATIDLYQSTLGNLLQPEHLVDVRAAAPRPA